MEPIRTVNDYPIGWEWLANVPLEDFNWLIEIFSTMTDDTDTYDFATFDKEATNGEPPYPVIEIERKGLANFLNDDQGYESGISMYGHYIACKSLNISSEEEYMNQFTDIKLICNEKNFRLMKNNELLKKYAGISTRIRRIFAYHYDQIQREVQTEISTLNPELQGQFMDLVIEYMEESINWPDPDNQEAFEKQLLG